MDKVVLAWYLSLVVFVLVLELDQGFFGWYAGQLAPSTLHEHFVQPLGVVLLIRQILGFFADLQVSLPIELPVRNELCFI